MERVSPSHPPSEKAWNQVFFHQHMVVTSQRPASVHLLLLVVSRVSFASAFGVGAPIFDAVRTKPAAAFAYATADDDSDTSNRLAILRKQLAETALPSGKVEAERLLSACEGLERGASASADDAARVVDAVTAFEAAAPCRVQGDALVRSLGGRWELVYSSALVRRAGSGSTGRRLIDASTPTLGAVTQTTPA